jgi:hypothetical protein
VTRPRALQPGKPEAARQVEDLGRLGEARRASPTPAARELQPERSVVQMNVVGLLRRSTNARQYITA